MKTTTKFIPVAALGLILFSCGRADDRSMMEANEKVVQDSVAIPLSSSAAVEPAKDTTHKFIRSAEMKFRVKNVVSATYQVEDLVGNAGGYVTYTNLRSEINYKTITPVSADSSLETLHYTVSDEMSLRVPNTRLDSVLKAMAGLVDYLDYRIIRANDVSLEILRNRMNRARMDRHAERLEKAIDSKGKKLEETTYAEETLLNKEEQADAATIANLSRQDQIDYSTVNVVIYQREGLKRTLITNEKNIDAYEPGLGSQLLDALKTGWKIVVKLLVILADCWAVVLLAVGVIWVLRKYGRKAKGSNF